MSGLQEFHHFEDKPDKVRQIVMWVALALVLGGGAFYVMESGMLRPQPQEAAKPYPRGL
jgi:hypothetical protein